MKFTKMHGIGNDYVYVNCFEEQVLDAPNLAIKLSKRHFGVCSDGLILICPSDVADFRMEMYNADGSRGKMCGNGIRCVGKYVYDKGLTDKTIVKIETDSGIKTLELMLENNLVKSVKVNMGSPELLPEKIPVSLNGEQIVNHLLEIDGEKYHITCVSMGNPHAVIFCDNVDDLELEKIGPKFEKHEIFPEQVNTEFVQVIDKNTLKMRVWERGSGETLACGTGACATLVAAVLNKKSDETAKIILKGGELEISWDKKENLIYMTGPAEFVFDGQLYI